MVLAEKNRTGKWLAQQLGKNEATVSRWCSNTAQPSLEMVIKIASVLKIDLADSSTVELPYNNGNDINGSDSINVYDKIDECNSLQDRILLASFSL